MTTPVTDYWEQLVGAALLGTDRRDPPQPPPGMLADLAADNPQPAPAERLLQQVAATVAVRRAGLRPSPAATPIHAPPDDDRPVIAAAAADTWRRIVTDWPVLEDEWLLNIAATNHRVLPELIEPLLTRHRNDPVRHARVRLAAGVLADWLIGLQPHLDTTSATRPAADAVVTLPELAVSPDLQPLLIAPAHMVIDTLVAACAAGEFGPPHRGVLVNLVARTTPASLQPLAESLAATNPDSPSIGIALALADLAALRHHMLAQRGAPQ